MRLPAVLPVALLLWALPAWAQPGPNPYLAQARVFYQGLEFERCLQRLNQAVDRESTVREQAEIALYAGLCNAQLGNFEEAEPHFSRALELDRTLELPPYTSPKIEALFKEVAAKLPPVDDKAPRKLVLTPTESSNPTSPALVLQRQPQRSYVAPVAFGGAALLAGGAATYFGLQAQRRERLSDKSEFSTLRTSLGELFPSERVRPPPALPDGERALVLDPSEAGAAVIVSRELLPDGVEPSRPPP